MGIMCTSMVFALRSGAWVRINRCLGENGSLLSDGDRVSEAPRTVSKMSLSRHHEIKGAAEPL